MVAVNGDVMVVRPRSKVRRRFSRGENNVYRGLGLDESVAYGGGFGGVAGSGGTGSLESGVA